MFATRLPHLRTPLKTLHLLAKHRLFTNYYKLFPQTFPQGPPPVGSFDVDLKKLRNEYLKLQQASHPDVAADGAELDAATLGSAYRALKDPLQRSEHILQINNKDPLSETKSLDNEELLMELMMLREEAAEAESPEELAKLRKENDLRVQSTVDELSNAFATENWPKAQELTIKLSYWRKLGDALEPKD